MIRCTDTKYGKVRGIPADDPRVTVFRGIPFAAPPTGENRWRAPEPPECWSGVRQCIEFGPASMQDIPGVNDDLYSREFHVDSNIPISEDSLYLNIWTGARDVSERLPVLVWIYGGAFQWGYTSEMEFNGERLARHGIVVVTVAYRLGVFGFLAHPELSSDDPQHPANFGLLDQQAALRWVYENIASFGGDPENITLGGQSAGGASVTYALANPDNASMIKKISVFSGFIRNPFYTDTVIMPGSLEKAEENGTEFIKYLGCSSVEEARMIDSCTIRDAYFEYVSDHPRFVPCIDGKYATDDPLEVLIKGNDPDVPILAGYTKDEFMEKLPSRADKVKEVMLADTVEKKNIKYVNLVQNTVRIVAKAYAASRRKSPMFVYGFGPDIPGWDDPGAFHSCDLWFFFENIQKCWRPYTGSHYELSRRMCDYWTNFIRTGDVNGMGYDGNPLPKWDSIEGDAYIESEMFFR